MNLILGVGLGVFGLAIAFAWIYKKMVIDKQIQILNNLEDEVAKSKIKAKEILENAEKEAVSKGKEIELKAKERAYSLKEEAEKEIRNSKNEILQKEARLAKKEETLDHKIEKLENKSQELERTTEELEQKREEIETVKREQEAELERITGLTKTEAKEILIAKLKEELTHENALAIREFENKLEDEKDRISRRILSTAIGKAAADYVADATVSVVNLPSDEMKGRIIGREGRNIRSIESLTGVDIIIDDTPEAVVLSSFDGVKREIARITIEKLITDGRIHPGKIEEVVNKAKKEVEKEITAAGEEAILELSIPGLHPDIIKTLGRLKFRTSYGQNVLVHSIEVAKIAATLAAEIGADVELAKRAGLLHDIGKILEHDVESSHAIIGGEYLKKFGEKATVINAVMAHHNEVEFETIEAVLVQAADAVSASRPGARRETLTAYIKRLEQLEEIANSFQGVESSFAIQAGRELRMIINPDKVNDDEATVMSREVAKKIEETMQYPGQIKVTIVRETRAVEYAK
ncbi:ribonuclease Y [Fusobacterium necrophorum]|uniref:ribonuclease Y n=1 Tax=Fusobacterium necrophorum TaxID=859 RepID=UPI0007899991|nr:ribonuclease Y [Fusobacterium necrophorum]KYM61359.1 ribonuclease Y [Fusobacterium necrophorum subsp. funduliforme]MDK4475646.1 ribonuclease Y [Fusobacterium necrophorum]MDK4492350.1 ribonuclease Y [Fusobacterium necrophorum]